MNKVIEIGSREGGLGLEVCVALSPDVRWSSKVVEMKGFIGPESEKIFQKKISSGNFSPELDELPTLRFLAKSLL